MTKYEDQYRWGLLKSLRFMNMRLDMAVWTGEGPLRRLPWVPVAGGKCPYCHGYGKDDSGPGAWSCKECDATGTLPRGHLTQGEFIILGNDHYPKNKFGACLCMELNGITIYEKYCAECGYPWSWHIKRGNDAT